MKRVLFILLLLIAGLSNASGQCSMCRAVVENNADNLGQGLNNGILYLMGFPYIIMIVVGTLLFRYQYRSGKPAV